MKKSTMWVIGLGILMIVLSGPLLTNILMSIKAPDFLVPKEGISTDGVWVGFMATFYGAIIGGTISGLITYLGVLKTINSQNEQNKKDELLNKRCFLHIQEIYNAELDLKNLNVKKSRLILRDAYADYFWNKAYREQPIFNFIELKNNDNNRCLNCNIVIVLKKEADGESVEKEFYIPVINKEEKVYIHIDPHPMYDYRLLDITMTYETIANEKMKMERRFTQRNGEYFGKDTYYVYCSEKEDYRKIFNIDGSSDEWIYISHD
ncbi:hypothetical protein [Bacillus cereus group sp. MG6]|uniref:hypothetical protein n=1 Tax=Bacillus cereus group sp. MG6 TaxID=3040246 RepID=UPI0033968546